MPNELEDVFNYIERKEPDECWPWHGPWGGRERDRRPYFWSYQQRQIAYRVVYKLVHGVELEREQIILHSCDNGSRPIGCCNPAHLRIGTVQENSNDMTLRERHGLPTNVVKHIQKLINQRRRQADIAELYGVSRETVSAIATGRVYKHVGRWRGDHENLNGRED
jgi:predicted XRE-type DNA-binding protein